MISSQLFFGADVEDLREGDIVASKFWASLLQLSKGSDFEAYQHGLFLLFLARVARFEIQEEIVRQIWKSDDPGNSNSQIDEGLRHHPVINWLFSESPEIYNSRLNRVYAATLVALGLKGGRSFKVGGTVIWPQKQIAYFHAWHRDAGSNWLLETFDYGHAALLKGALDLAREEFSANLAVSCMTSDAGDIADIFSPIASFAREFADRVSGPVRCFINPARATQYTAMRLHMQDILFSYVQANIKDGISLALPNVDFILLDPISTSEINPLFLESAKSDQDEHVLVGELAEQLCSAPDNFGLALLVLPQAYCRPPSELYAIRQRLVEEGQLVAVIDFPNNATTEKRKFSGWLIAGRSGPARSRNKHILFVDSQPLSRLSSRYDASVTADFIGALVAGFLENTNKQIELINRLEISEPLLASIFAREFTPGEYEAPGLSQIVPIEEIRKRGYTLSAKPYLSTPANDTWTRGIQRHELDAILAQRNVLGRRIYVIGNNGEGKSLLLKDISQEMAEKKRRTVAIAFGATDRFPTRLPGPAGANYLYRGARTSTAGINAVKTAVTIGGLILHIHADEQRFKVFEQILMMVGFASRQYLIPKELKAKAHADEKLLRGVVMLSSDDADDKAMIRRLRQNPINARQYKLGMRRLGSRDSILPFDELSSGEQQIILLIAKITAEAARDVLFLIDEPEISLHVSWQRAVPKLLKHIAEEFGADILIATHSPVIIASADDSDDFCFTVRDRGLKLLSLEDRNSVETVLFEGFRTYTKRNREVHERCASLVADAISALNGVKVEVDQARVILDKFDDMTLVLKKQTQFADEDDLSFDLLLVERAKAAVMELVKLANSTKAQRREV